MPHVLGLKQKDVCQRVGLLNRDFSGLCSGNLLCWNQGRTGQEKLQAKRRPTAATHALHAFSTPIGRDCEGGNERWCEWCGERLSFRVERDCKFCQFKFKITKGEFKMGISRRMMLIPDWKTVWLAYKNDHQPTMILSTMTCLHVTRQNEEYDALK